MSIERVGEIQMKQFFSVVALLAAGLSAGVLAQSPPCSAPSQTPQTPQLKPAGDGSPYMLPAGTVIRVKMDNGITSRSASVNDTFTTTVAAPVIVRSVEVIPAGTVIEGRVVKVGHAKRGGGAGFINISFETLKLKDGTTRKIAGELGAGEENDPADTDADIDTGDIDKPWARPRQASGLLRAAPGPERW